MHFRSNKCLGDVMQTKALHQALLSLLGAHPGQEKLRPYAEAPQL